MGLSWTSPLRPWWLDDMPVRRHKVNHKVNQDRRKLIYISYIAFQLVLPPRLSQRFYKLLSEKYDTAVTPQVTREHS